MSSFWDQVRKLFQSAEESSPSNPVIHKMIERSEEQKTQFEDWQDSYVCQQLYNWLGDQYALFQTGNLNLLDDAIDFLNTPSTKGFVVHFHKTQYSPSDVMFFADSLKQRVLALKYRTQISDSRTFNKDRWVETIERHYLKPRPHFKPNEKFKQQFGNITVQHVLRNDQPHHVRLGATIYKDHMYEEAEDFQSLMGKILFK